MGREHLRDVNLNDLARSPPQILIDGEAQSDAYASLPCSLPPIVTSLLTYLFFGVFSLVFAATSLLQLDRLRN